MNPAFGSPELLNQDDGLTLDHFGTLRQKQIVLAIQSAGRRRDWEEAWSLPLPLPKPLDTICGPQA